MKAKRLTRLGILIALSVVGSFIKIPSPVGSLAFDAVPGYFAALSISPGIGALVAALGHAATATVSGLPLGPLHMVVALGMALAAYSAGRLARVNLYLGSLVGVLINGLLLPAIFILLPDFGLPFFWAVTPSILVAALLNVSLAVALHSLPSIKRITHVQ